MTSRPSRQEAPGIRWADPRPWYLCSVPPQKSMPLRGCGPPRGFARVQSICLCLCAGCVFPAGMSAGVGHRLHRLSLSRRPPPAPSWRFCGAARLEPELHARLVRPNVDLFLLGKLLQEPAAPSTNTVLDPSYRFSQRTFESSGAVF